MVYYTMTKDETIRVYVSNQTKDKIKDQAEREGLKPSSWLRRLAKKELPREVEA